MRSFKLRAFQFVRTVYVMDLRSDALSFRIADIKRRARRYEVLHHTANA